MPVITCVEDLRLQAKRRVPRMFYDYADSGSWSESTYRSNTTDLAALRLRQRVAMDVSERDLRTTMVGEPVTMPIAMAPTGLTGMQHADGEILAARACRRFGVPFTLSTMSICSIEDVAQDLRAPFWFQLYLMRDRRFMEGLIARAIDAGCSALVLTLDLQVMGQRHKDLRNGLSAPPKLTLANLFDMALRPRWCLGMLRTKRRQFGNIVGHVEGVDDMASLAAWTAQQFDPSLSWRDVAWVRERWPGKFVLKGILDPDDARAAVDSGADAIVVSNHGGRQLDGAPSTIAALPSIVAAVAARTEIWFDGGVQSGQDILKALALGAHSTMAGRAFLYGLGASGEAGVTKVLEIIRKELDISLALCGRRSVREVDDGVLWRDGDRAEPSGDRRAARS